MVRGQYLSSRGTTHGVDARYPSPGRECKGNCMRGGFAYLGSELCRQ